MTLKWIGAALIIVGSSTVGYSMVASHRNTESALRNLIVAVDFMASELQFRLTPLPILSKLTSKQVSGPIARAFHVLSVLLEQYETAEVHQAMTDAVAMVPSLPVLAKENLLRLGQTLGRFDLQGQLSGLASVKEMAQRDLEGMQIDKDSRLRSYQTLGICAGVALVILFI